MKRIIAIGGGSIKDKTTAQIDGEIARLAKLRAGDKRAYGLFIGTASHDCMPAFNSFRKTFTSVYDIKADCLLLVNVQTSDEKIDEKLNKADFIYVGGGDTLYMLEIWKQRGLINKLINAYNRGVIITGLSAGAICWFEHMYTDSEILNGKSNEYVLTDGIGVLSGLVTPHYNLRQEDFDRAFLTNGCEYAYAIEDNCALSFIDGKLERSISSGGKAYEILSKNGKIQKNLL